MVRSGHRRACVRRSQICRGYRAVVRERSLRKTGLLLLRRRRVSLSGNKLRELTTEPPANFVQTWFAETPSNPRAGLVQRRGGDQTSGQVPQRFNECLCEINRGAIDRGGDCVTISTYWSVSGSGHASNHTHLVASWTCPNSASLWARMSLYGCK